MGRGAGVQGSSSGEGVTREELALGRERGRDQKLLSLDPLMTL